MRAVIQRVTSARVRVGERVVGEIHRGLLVLLGVGRDDTETDVRYVTGKIRDGASSKPTPASRWTAQSQT